MNKLLTHNQSELAKERWSNLASANIVVPVDNQARGNPISANKESVYVHNQTVHVSSTTALSNCLPGSEDSSMYRQVLDILAPIHKTL